MHKRHYQILLAATLGCFLLLLATEVAGRYSETISQYEEMGEREALVASPESLVVRRVALKAREDTLKRELDRAAGEYGRTFAGFLSLASIAAQETKVTLTGVAPIVSSDETPSRERHFRILCKGEYHRIAQFVNRLENSPLDIQLGRVGMKRGGVRDRLLDSTIEGHFEEE